MDVTLEGYNLTEEQQAGILEAIKEKVKEEKSILEAELAESKGLLSEAKATLESQDFDAKVKLYEEETNEKISKFLEAQAEEFINENKTDIVDQMKLNHAENMLEAMVELFEKFNIGFADEKRDALIEAYKTIDELEGKVVSLETDLAESKSLLSEALNEFKLSELLEGLDQLTSEKARELFETTKSLEAVSALLEAKPKGEEKDDEEKDDNEVDDVDLNTDEKSKEKMKKEEKSKSSKKSKTMKEELGLDYSF